MCRPSNLGSRSRGERPPMGLDLALPSSAISRPGCASSFSASSVGRAPRSESSGSLSRSSSSGSGSRSRPRSDIAGEVDRGPSAAWAAPGTQPGALPDHDGITVIAGGRCAATIADHRHRVVRSPVSTAHRRSPPRSRFVLTERSHGASGARVMLHRAHRAPQRRIVRTKLHASCAPCARRRRQHSPASLAAVPATAPRPRS